MREAAGSRRDSSSPFFPGTARAGKQHAVITFCVYLLFNLNCCTVEFSRHENRQKKNEAEKQRDREITGMPHSNNYPVFGSDMLLPLE
jgi:hypothetical protein